MRSLCSRNHSQWRLSPLQYQNLRLWAYKTTQGSLAPFLYPLPWGETATKRNTTTVAKGASPDPEDVYLQCSSIFIGKPSGSKKKLAKVTATLKKHESSLKGLTEKYTLSQIAVVAQELVLQQIFASPAKARARFPKLYSKSSGKDAERAASEAATLQQNEQKVAVKAQTADDLAHDNQVATRNITDVDPKVSAETEPSLEQ